MAGIVGAIFNCALQLGAAVGISAVTSIEYSIERESEGGYSGFDGRRAGYWYMFALAGALFIVIAVFYREKCPKAAEAEAAKLPMQEKPEAGSGPVSMGEKAV
jgi:hypothetical protein